MRNVRRRQTLLVFALALPVSAAITALFIGPRYLEPLPMWAKGVVAAACCAFIAAAAIYSRSRRQGA